MTGKVNEDLTLQRGVWSIVRKTLPSLKASAMRDFREIISDNDLWSYVSVKNLGREFICGNRMVEFFSIDDEQKVRSRKRDILHVCEANEIDTYAFTQLDLRTKYRVYIDFNPDDKFVWINTDLEQKRAELEGDVNVVISTYKDNPFLTDEEVRKIEYLEKADPELWSVFGKGEYGKITGTIYQEYQVVKYPDKKEFDYEYLGIDWGFSHDPAAVVIMTKVGNRIYAKELVYETHLSNEELMSRIRSQTKVITGVGDSAEPKSISEFNGSGFSLSSSKKGPDSVRAGIQLVKSYEMHIDPDSVNLLAELRSYKWREGDGKDGVPVDLHNHALDALRYCVTTFFPRSGGLSFGGSVSNTRRPDL